MKEKITLIAEDETASPFDSEILTNMESYKLIHWRLDFFKGKRIKILSLSTLPVLV